MIEGKIKTFWYKDIEQSHRDFPVGVPLELPHSGDFVVAREHRVTESKRVINQGEEIVIHKVEVWGELIPLWAPVDKQNIAVA